MKTERYTPRQALVLSTLLFLMAPQVNSPAQTPDLRLIGERSGDSLTLSWTGASGVRLQKSTCLCGWEYAPIPDTNCTIEVTMGEPAAFFRLVDVFADTDDDLLTRAEEEAGWTIFIDTSGYGESRLVEMHVTSDPEIIDTDADGLSDIEEWIFGADPRNDDTDHDGLSDYDEVYRWHSSPTSVDTDGDARGPDHNLPPKARLFDGEELRVLHTSPTLEDTDGDGRTDYEEYDQLGRSPLVAELPRLEVQLVDAVDIRLDVQYAEEAGVAREYGRELSITDSSRFLFSADASVNMSTTVGGECTVVAYCADAKVKAELTMGVQFGIGFELETSRSLQRSLSEYATDSRTRTETAASGSMSAGIRLVNSGPVSYTVTDLGVTVRYLQPPAGLGTPPSFRTLATLLPEVENGITLAPGDSTPVLQIQATDLNASRVKEFMARPRSLYLEPAFYEIENAGGLNFDFLEEVTRWRTARVQIDFGDGRNEEYRIATNVERNEDGSYAGVTLGNVMSNILQIPFQTVPLQALQPGATNNQRVLYSVRDVQTWPNAAFGHWVMFRTGQREPSPYPDFENIVLRAGDEFLLVFATDGDADGLFAPEEQHFGTDDSATADSDEDGLSDVFEAHTGWDVIVQSVTNRVYSDPAQADQDGDALTDFQEYQKGTDPTRPDTDADGLTDAADPHPLAPARVLRVKWDAVPNGTNGTTWAAAFINLQDALAIARAGVLTTNDATDDVAEIWVAAGIYKPGGAGDRTNRFELVSGTSLYGGFIGVESKLAQRHADPLFNGCVLSGDLQGNDASTYAANPASFSDNSLTVCSVTLPSQLADSGTVLDGFTIMGGNGTTGGGLRCIGNPRLRNLLFRANHATNSGGGLYVQSDRPILVSDCTFVQNSAERSGGAMQFSGAGLLLTNCQFIQNHTRVFQFNYGYGGGALAAGGGDVQIEGCTFTLNNTPAFGGAIYFSRGPSTGWRAGVSRSHFRQNNAAIGGAIGTFDLEGLSLPWNPIAIEVAQSAFWGNRATNSANGGGVYVGSDGASLFVINSTLTTNISGVSGSGGPGGGITVGLGSGARIQVLVENSIVWGNGQTNILIQGTNATCTVRTSCLPEANSWPAAGNLNANPGFVNFAAGDLRLGTGSPCIDTGNNLIDYSPAVPGFQLLPGTDINGDSFWRLLDGNGDTTPTVDMGAHEYRP